MHSDYVAVQLSDNSSVYITNCSFQTDSEVHFTLLNHNSTLTLSDGVNMVSGCGLSNQGNGTTNALPGTYNFDVSSYVDTNAFTVTENTEAGTWTVAAR